MASITQYETKSGKKLWRYQYTTGIDPLTGKVKRTTKRGFRTKKEAEISASRAMLNVENHGYAENQNITYKEVYDYFMKSYQNTVKGSTLNRVLGLFKYHILPVLGKYPIKKISVPMCQDMVNHWSTELKDYRKIKNYAGLVFKEAKRLKMIYDNPIELVILPKKPPVIGSEKWENFWDKDELQLFFQYLNQEYSDKNEKAITLFRLLAFSGMRKGEALALNWSDINFNDCTVSINKTVTRAVDNKMVLGTPKTNKSIRTIDLDNKTISILKNWRKIQREEMLMLGFNTDNIEQLIFPNSYNKLLSFTKPNRWLDHIIDKYNLKHITVHGLRHTACALLFESGATIKQVQERLGHSDAETTLNIYAHVSKYAKKETATKFAEYMNF